MSNQASLFDEVQLEVSRRRDTLPDYRRQVIFAVQDAGTRKALAAEDPAWIERASEVIERFASSGETFSADDVRVITGDPIRPGSLGGVFRSAVRQGLVTPAGIATSNRVVRHGGIQRLWRRVPAPDRREAS